MFLENNINYITYFNFGKPDNGIVTHSRSSHIRVSWSSKSWSRLIVEEVLKWSFY